MVDAVSLLNQLLNQLFNQLFNPLLNLLLNPLLKNGLLPGVGRDFQINSNWILKVVLS